MASMNQRSQAIANTSGSCGRSFASVDPERQREVEFHCRPAVKALTTLARPSRGTAEWFNPPRAPSPQSGSSRGSR